MLLVNLSMYSASIIRTTALWSTAVGLQHSCVFKFRQTKGIVYNRRVVYSERLHVNSLEVRFTTLFTL